MRSLALPESRPLAGAPVASLRCRILRPGKPSISLGVQLEENVCRVSRHQV